MKYILLTLWLAASGCKVTMDFELTVEKASVGAPFSCKLGTEQETCSNIQLRTRVYNDSNHYTRSGEDITVYSYDEPGGLQAVRFGGTFELDCNGGAPWVIPPKSNSQLIALDVAYDPATLLYRIGYPCGGTKKWASARTSGVGAFEFASRPVVGDGVFIEMHGAMDTSYAQLYASEADAVLAAN